MEPLIVLPASTAPRVSIIIVAMRQPQLLARCLESLARCGSTIPFEVVVVLNDAIPEVATLVRERVSGVTVTASAVPLGLAGGANRGRAAARGELLVILHDDAEAQPGWLEGLVAAADSYPEAGAVGSRMFNPDGTPQSMGFVLWSDAKVWILGHGPDSLVPASKSITAVDFCGSASLLLRAATWDAIGGADERLYPAYFVDVELCFGVWMLGQAVLCTPDSQVRHHRGSSTDPRFREFLYFRNQERFREKWRGQLEAFEPPAIGSVEGIERAIERAQERWRRARRAAVGGSRAAEPRPRLDAGAQERRVLEIALDLQRAWAKHLSGELERALAERDLALAAAAPAEAPAGAVVVGELTVLRERSAMLAAIERGRWWRLYRRLLPLFRLLRGVRRRAAANRTE